MATSTATTPAPHPLPDLSHLGSADFERVYEPSDDTFLLVDALAADAASLQVHSRYTLTLHAPRSHALTLPRSHALTVAPTLAPTRHRRSRPASASR